MAMMNNPVCRGPTLMRPTCCAASPSDAGAIAALVNRAYCPAPAQGGWTHEANWVQGMRISEDRVLALLRTEPTVLLLHDGGAVISCVHVRIDGHAAHIGMLATDPALQGVGLGTRMLDEAEQHAAREPQVEQLQMEVLDRRLELLDFYRRRGYKPTGLVKDYPAASGLGMPMVEDLKVLQLTKAIERLPRRTETVPR
jgi:ribosomal protein S18 acetylase RimI-like enzyme